tara:strand:+ start:209 stop:664 length:456 start_codon:yes stop_codon:yes gene_type:complete
MVNIQYLEGKKNFDSFLLNNKNDVILLIFSATWCGPCQAFKKYLSIPESEILYPGLQAVCLDTDAEGNEDLCDFYEIASLPTYFFVYLDSENNLRATAKQEGYNEAGFVQNYTKAIEYFKQFDKPIEKEVEEKLVEDIVDETEKNKEQPKN